MHVQTGLVLLLYLLACGGCSSSTKKSTDELIKDLKTGEDKERIAAVRTVKGDAAKLVPALIEALKDPDSDVRRSAAIRLGIIGEEAKDAIPTLQKRQHDGDARVREAAAKALARIDPAQFPPPSPPQAAQEK